MNIPGGIVLSGVDVASSPFRFLVNEGNADVLLCPRGGGYIRLRRGEAIQMPVEKPDGLWWACHRDRRGRIWWKRKRPFAAAGGSP